MITFKEALEYNKEHSFGCGNGSDNEAIVEFIKDLYKLGVKNIEVALHNGQFHTHDELYITFGKKITKSMLVKIVSLHPDGVSEENGKIRLWWD